MPAGFKDHFSTRSDCYAQHRPRYPDELFRVLASMVDRHSLAWDCATGNGQVAVGLAEFFSTVIASDASSAQINAATPHSKVTYQVFPAEKADLESGSVELVTVGQAFHWFDSDAFFQEARRVLRPSGVLAIWCYQLSRVSPDCDAIIDRLYAEIVGDYWPPERALVESGYDGVELPGEVLQAPALEMSLRWRVEDMLGYLRTWSACKRYEADKGSDPVAEIAPSLTSAWGNRERDVVWPLQLKLSRID